MPPPQPVALLAGGRSSRFGSDKARAVVGNETLLLRNLRALAVGSNEVFVVGPPCDTYADLGVTSVPDRTPDEGPMGGLITALTHRRSRWGQGPLGVCACDFVLCIGPNVPGLLAIQLAGHHRPPGLLARLPDMGFDFNPVFGAYHTDALPQLEAAFARGERSLTRWVKSQPAESIDIGTIVYPPPSFNTPDEFRKAVALALAFDAYHDFDDESSENEPAAPIDA